MSIPLTNLPTKHLTNFQSISFQFHFNSITKKIREPNAHQFCRRVNYNLSPCDLSHFLLSLLKSETFYIVP
ncbi:hypothetical protein HanIR_Chr14g0710331 [Helianthus annuus]|nr:hypothetical protein HanIR_Chr14g0710331 [Helianthus annuus]